MQDEADDQDLVRRMQQGEQQAFNLFFENYAQRLASFAARRTALDAADIEDVVQQTLILAVRNLGGFRGDASLFTWLCQICRHQLADLARKAARRPPTGSLDQLLEHDPVVLPPSLVVQRDPLEESGIDSERQEVRRAVSELPPRYVQILELRYGDELTLPAIARLLGLSDDAAESLLSRARRAFRERWVGRSGVPEAKP